MAVRKKKVQVNRITNWPEGALLEPRGKGLRSKLTEVEPRPVEEWLASPSEAGLKVGDIVEVVTDPQKLQPKADLIPGEVLEIPTTGISILVRFTAFETAEGSSGKHRSFVQWIPAWKLRRSEGGVEALNFMANFDEASGGEPIKVVAKSSDALEVGLQEVGPATHVASLLDGQQVTASHTIIGGVQLLTLFKKDGTVSLTAKSNDRSATRALLLTLVPSRSRATESQTPEPTKKEKVAA